MDRDDQDDDEIEDDEDVEMRPAGKAASGKEEPLFQGGSSAWGTEEPSGPLAAGKGSNTFKMSPQFVADHKLSIKHRCNGRV
jgi:hypothetical protein